MPEIMLAYARIYAGISVRGDVLEFMLAFVLAYTPAQNASICLLSFLTVLVLKKTYHSWSAQVQNSWQHQEQLSERACKVKYNNRLTLVHVRNIGSLVRAHNQGAIIGEVARLRLRVDHDLRKTGCGELASAFAQTGRRISCENVN